MCVGELHIVKTKREGLDVKDTLAGAAAAGIAATVAIVTAEWALSLAGVIPPVTQLYIATLILPAGQTVPGPGATAAVVLAGLTASAFFAILLAYLLRLTGKDFWLLKGAGYGGFLFIVHVSLIPKLWEPRLAPLFESSAVLVWEVVDKVSWSILVAYLLITVFQTNRNFVRSRS